MMNSMTYRIAVIKGDGIGREVVPEGIRALEAAAAHHGSAPDIAGQGIANPIGQIWSASMMLAHSGETDAGQTIVAAIETVLAEERLRTRDLGGPANTEECGKAMAAAMG